MRNLLAISLIGNCLLVAALFSPIGAPRREFQYGRQVAAPFKTDPPAASGQESPRRLLVFSSEMPWTPDTVAAVLQSAGVSERVIAAAVRSSATAQQKGFYNARAEEILGRMRRWNPNPDLGPEWAKRSLRTSNSVGQAILAAMASQQVGGERYAGIPRAKEAEINSVERRYHDRQLEAMRHPGAQSANHALKDASRLLLEDLRQVLSPGEFESYIQYSSPWAQDLQGMLGNILFTTEEYDGLAKAYLAPMLSGLDVTPAPPNRNGLLALIGEHLDAERFLRVVSTVDPSYGLADEVLQANGASTEARSDLYRRAMRATAELNDPTVPLESRQRIAREFMGHLAAAVRGDQNVVGQFAGTPLGRFMTEAAAQPATSP